MRTIVPITCVLCIATASRADTPPAGAASSSAPEPAPEPAATAAAAPATPATAPAAPATPATATARPGHSRIPEIAATVVTGGLVTATAASYWKWNQTFDRRRSVQWDLNATPDELARAVADGNTWKRRTWLLLGATVMSAGATMFLWMRNQDPSSFSVQPTDDGDGAAVSYSGQF